MPTSYRLVIRRRGRTEKQDHATLTAALDALEAELRAAATVVAKSRRTEKGLGREYAPEQQVAVRGELRGPGRLRAGIDVRGDGSAEAYTGRVRRELVEQRPREDAYQALRRTLGDR
jgi:hypothetical protein